MVLPQKNLCSCCILPSTPTSQLNPITLHLLPPPRPQPFSSAVAMRRYSKLFCFICFVFFFPKRARHREKKLGLLHFTKDQDPAPPAKHKEGKQQKANCSGAPESLCCSKLSHPGGGLIFISTQSSCCSSACRACPCPEDRSGDREWEGRRMDPELSPIYGAP